MSIASGSGQEKRKPYKVFQLKKNNVRVWLKTWNRKGEKVILR